MVLRVILLTVFRRRIGAATRRDACCRIVILSTLCLNGCLVFYESVSLNFMSDDGIQSLSSDPIDD